MFFFEKLITKIENLSRITPYKHYKRRNFRKKNIACPLFLKLNNEGSATVEALLVLPVFITFIVAVIWLIDLFRIHCEVGMVLNEVGGEITDLSYVYCEGLELTGLESAEIIVKLGGTVYSTAMVKSRIDKTDVGSKIQGLSVAFKSNDLNREISLRAAYYVPLYISIPGVKGVLLSNAYYSKSFTGYEICKDEAQEYVFVTKNSEVYHTSENCQGLKTTIAKAFRSEIDDKRSADGSKYYPCSKCNAKKSGEYVYYTPTGNRYHSTAACGELKIDLYKVPLREVEDRRLCYYCKNGY